MDAYVTAKHISAGRFRSLKSQACQDMSRYRSLMHEEEPAAIEFFIASGPEDRPVIASSG